MGCSYRDINFGIEVEFTGISRKQAARVVADYFNSQVEFVGGGYNRYITFDSLGRKWRLERDSTITAQRKNENSKRVKAKERFKVELVSPVLTYEEIPQLQELIRTLRRNGAFTNKKCAVHIHIDGTFFKENAEALRHLTKIIYSKQKILQKALKVHRDRKSYCKDVEEEVIEKLDKYKSRTLEEFGRIWFNLESFQTMGRYNRKRYFILNPTSLLSSTQSKDTVELRIFNSKLHAGLIKSFIQYSLLVAERSLNVKRASSKETIPPKGNEKWAMRQHLLKLGAKGEEFKSMRFHFLKNLEGDMAFRDMRRVKKK